jgi:hypothetical protein
MPQDGGLSEVGTRMPLYHFNVYFDRQQRDVEGMELPDKDAAWEEATTAAGEMLKSLDRELKPGKDWKMEVTDEFQNTLWEIHIKALKR